MKAFVEVVTKNIAANVSIRLCGLMSDRVNSKWLNGGGKMAFYTLRGGLSHGVLPSFMYLSSVIFAYNLLSFNVLCNDRCVNHLSSIFHQ